MTLMKTAPIIATVWMLLVVCDVFAHRLLLSVEVSLEHIRIEAFYDDDTPATEAKVSIFDSQDQLIITGKMNDRGQWSTKRLPPGEYQVHVSSVGHATKKSITIPKLDPTNGVHLEKESLAQGENRDSSVRSPFGNAILGLLIISIGTFIFMKMRRRFHDSSSEPKIHPAPEASRIQQNLDA